MKLIKKKRVRRKLTYLAETGDQVENKQQTLKLPLHTPNRLAYKSSNPKVAPYALKPGAYNIINSVNS